MKWVIWAWVLGCNAPIPAADEAPHQEDKHEATDHEGTSAPNAHGADVGEVPDDKSPAPEVMSEGVAAVYELGFEQAHGHLVDVDMRIDPEGAEALVVYMPAWTPGSYLIREYAQNIQTITATDGEGLVIPMVKQDKLSWTIDVGDAEEVRVLYTLYGRTMSVRTNHVESEFAVLNGAPTFLLVDGRLSRPHEVRFSPPSSWTDVATALPPHESGAPHHYVASDADQLIDCPVLLGDLDRHTFDVGGLPHQLINLGEDDTWDGDRSVEDVAAIVEEAARLWGALPYEQYQFLNVLMNGGGGLEHMDSTLMMASPDLMSSEVSYKKWLGLVSHEFFHVWNVKRFRPAGLGPFEYREEVYTPSLWVAEGWTSYYDDLLLVRAGLLTESEHLGRLSDTLTAVRARPGRYVQALSEASHDAWIKFYRPNENSANTSVSYYRKGSLVAWLLDAEIRRNTDGRASLDDVLRLGWTRHGEHGYTEEQLRQLISEVAGRDLTEWLHARVDQPGALDLEPALEWWGLTLTPTLPDGPWTGLTSNPVSRVRRDSPAWEAGFQVGDEILGLDGERVTGSLDAALGEREAGDVVEVLYARRGRLATREVTLGEPPPSAWTLAVSPKRTTRQAQRVKAWYRPATGAVRVRPSP